MNDNLAEKWHGENLDKLRSAANGNRNEQLNKHAMASYQLALQDNGLTASKVEIDFQSLAESLGLQKNEVAATLRSALEGAKKKPRPEISSNHSQPVDKSNLSKAPERIELARTHEQWAIDHGATVATFTGANWEAKEHNGRPAWLIQHEDKITRVHHIDGETPKAYPIKPQDYKGSIAACWYGFSRAVAMAAKAAHKTIVLCNGQPSVVVGQSYQIAAIAQTGGENGTLTAPLLRRLLQAIKDHKLKVMLVFDGDKSGRNASKGIETQLMLNGITPQVVYFGGNDGYDLANHCKLYKERSFSKLQRLAAFNINTVQKVHCSQSLNDNFADFLIDTNEHVTAGEYVKVPFSSMHSLGGFAYMLEPGKMTGIIAPSGYGKTSWLDTWIEIFIKRGLDVFYYSPEWTPRQMHWRRIQRYGGATYDQIRDHALWHNEDSKGIPDGQKEGKRIKNASELHTKTLQINTRIGRFPGRVKYFTGERVTNAILKTMENEAQLSRRIGRRVGVAIFDYAQLLRTDGQEVKGKNSYELICEEIKDWAMRTSIHSAVGIQVTKEKAHAAITQKKLLTEYDASWVRPDTFNLMVSLNIQTEIHPQTEELYKTRLAKINVCKNNGGETGVLRMKTDFPKLQWLDENWG